MFELSTSTELRLVENDSLIMFIVVFTELSTVPGHRKCSISIFWLNKWKKKKSECLVETIWQLEAGTTMPQRALNIISAVFFKFCISSLLWSSRISHKACSWQPGHTYKLQPSKLVVGWDVPQFSMFILLKSIVLWGKSRNICKQEVSSFGLVQIKSAYILWNKKFAIGVNPSFKFW